MKRKLSEALTRKNVKYLILMILLSGFIGSILGEIIGFYTEEGSFLYKLFTKGTVIGLTQPFELDLKVFSFIFGLKVKLNLLSIIGFFFGVILFLRAKN
jgi:hypothetical protein